MASTRPLPDSKVCSKCGEIKPLSEYGQNRDRHKNIRPQSRCKVCRRSDMNARYRDPEHRAKLVIYRVKNADLLKAREKARRQKPEVKRRYRAYKERPENREKARLYSRKRHRETYCLRGAAWVSDRLVSARANAKRKGVPFDKEACRSVLENAPDVCPVFQVPLKAGSKRTPEHAALDEIIPGIGYVTGNVQVISELANRIKSNATAEQVMAVALWMKG